MQFVPYLSFNGNCREAFEFYRDVLGAQDFNIITHGETPAGEGVSAEWQDKVINAYLRSDGAELMGGDTPPEMGQSAMQGITISIQLDDEARAGRIFHALAEGGSIVMPLGPTFWARTFGMVTDRFGTPWMVNCGLVDQNGECAAEIDKRA
ncbi:MAG: VOC family protein [Rhizobiaceae bacterium]|jgi:PhnB protein